MSTHDRLAEAASNYAEADSARAPIGQLARLRTLLTEARTAYALEVTIAEIDEDGCPGGCGWDDGDPDDHITDIQPALPSQTLNIDSVVNLGCGYAHRVHADL